MKKLHIMMRHSLVSPDYPPTRHRVLYILVYRRDNCYSVLTQFEPIHLAYMKPSLLSLHFDAYESVWCEKDAHFDENKKVCYKKTCYVLNSGNWCRTNTISHERRGYFQELWFFRRCNRGQPGITWLLVFLLSNQSPARNFHGWRRSDEGTIAAQGDHHGMWVIVREA